MGGDSPRLNGIHSGSAACDRSLQHTSEELYENSEDTDNCFLQIPIIGFETMEQRAKFTVFKLQVQSLNIPGSWLVFRRYTDFCRLHDELKAQFTDFDVALPPKRWLKDNFDTTFLEQRMKGLQAMIDSILINSRLMETKVVRDFFCLDGPPSGEEIYNAEESKALSISLDEVTGTPNPDNRHALSVSYKDLELEILKAKLEAIIAQRNQLLKLINLCPNCSKKHLSRNSSSASSSYASSLTPSTTPLKLHSEKNAGELESPFNGE